MSYTKLIFASLAYHWRMNLAIALGVICGTAVLTGALLVGDSMKGSLRKLTLDRLGRIDEVLLIDHFFRKKLVNELRKKSEFKQHFNSAVPIILMQIAAEDTGRTEAARANQVNLIGCDESFWNLGQGRPKRLPTGTQIVLNQALADALQIKVGDAVILRMSKPENVPTDTPFGDKMGSIRSLRMQVIDITPNAGLGRFNLRPTQRIPKNAYASIDWLARRIGWPGHVNGILIEARNPKKPDIKDQKRLQHLLKPTPADYGIRIAKSNQSYINVTTDRMIFPAHVEELLMDAIRGQRSQTILTYLANTIRHGAREIPYSMISACNFEQREPLGPLLTPDENVIETPAKDEIVLNSWAAEDLGAKPGDTIRVTYFEPESTNGQIREKTAELKLAHIVKLHGASADPEFTPNVDGITDRKSIEEWSPPFPFDLDRIREKDEVYWQKHAATPKAFVSLETGRRLWGSRFGHTTSIRILPNKDWNVAQLTERLATESERLGFVFQSVKQQGLDASVGTTPFGVLFLAFSFFIIAAATMLVALLFKLGVDVRATQIGLLWAVGFKRSNIALMLTTEGAVIAMLACLVGVAAGLGYAALMLAGLNTLWLPAIGTPFLQLHFTLESLAVGYLSSLLVALCTIVFSVRQSGRVEPRRLMARLGDKATYGKSPSGLIGWLLLLLAACAAIIGNTQMGGEIRVELFFTAGAATLLGILMLVRNLMQKNSDRSAIHVGAHSLTQLAIRNATRNTGRSTLIVGLIAAACFLIVSVSAFQVDPSASRPAIGSGNGGFSLIMQCDQPIHFNLDTFKGREKLGFTADDSNILSDARIFPLRVKTGDDATCLNLYRPKQPRILGVTKQMIERGGFDWAESKVGVKDPWRSLSVKLPNDPSGTQTIPVVLDQNTARYSLQLWKGVGETFTVTNGQGKSVRLMVVGLLKGSIFQGDLLMDEEALLRTFPKTSGFQFFLVESKSDNTAMVADVLKQTLADHGASVDTTGSRMAELLQVQNTYLATFQSLGGLGLLMGTFGLAAVQLRNVVERRYELALLQAIGFRQRHLIELVMIENSLLLVLGLVCGSACAVVAIFPELLAGNATIPWTSLAATLITVLIVGLTACFLATRSILSPPLWPGLREE